MAGEFDPFPPGSDAVLSQEVIDSLLDWDDEEVGHTGTQAEINRLRTALGEIEEITRATDPTVRAASWDTIRTIAETALYEADGKALNAEPTLEEITADLREAIGAGPQTNGGGDAQP